MNRLLSFLVAAALVGCTQTTPAPTPAPVQPSAYPAPEPSANWRATPPAPTPARPYDFPDVERITLDNGLRVLVARTTNAPLVTVRAVVRSGAAHDSASKAGLATLMANLVDEGAGSRNAIQLAEAIGDLGASINAGADWDASFVNLDILRSQLPRGFEIFADVLRSPRFDNADFERVKRERLTSLLQQRDQANAIATNRFAQFVYAGTPYGNPMLGTEATVGGITRNDIRNFYNRHWVPNNTSLIMAGDIDVTTARELANRYLGAWKRGADVPDVSVSAPSIEQSRIFLVDRPAAVQSEIRVGHAGVSRSTEDYFPLITMNAILGGIFTSRLNLNLREKHGYTYGARSQFAFRRQAGPFLASTAVRNEVTTESVRETVGELKRLRTGDITESELKFAKDYLMGVFPATVEAASQLAQRIQELELYGLPPDYFDQYRQRIAAVTKNDIARVAQKYVNPDRSVILVVGKASEVHGPLQALGYNVGVYDIEGRPLAQ